MAKGSPCATLLGMFLPKRFENIIQPNKLLKGCTTPSVQFHCRDHFSSLIQLRHSSFPHSLITLFVPWSFPTITPTRFLPGKEIRHESRRKTTQFTLALTVSWVFPKF